MSLSVAQHKSQINGSSVTPTMTLSSAPTDGNLMILCVGVNIGVGSLTVNTAKWTLFDAEYDDTGTSYTGLLLYRYASSETTTMPAPCTAGTTYSGYVFYEISGVTGTWDTDFQTALGFHTNSRINGRAVPPLPMTNTALALSFTTNYNGNINSSFGGSWTLDEAANNSANFGSVAGAHRAVVSSNTIDGTWTTYAGSDTNPSSAFLVLIANGLPSTPYIKQTYTRSPTIGTPGAVTVPWTPHTGDLMLGYISWANGQSANPTTGGSWTNRATQAGAVTPFTWQNIMLSRYVSGDTSTLAAMATAGSTNFTQTVVVIGGANGSWSVDHVSDKTGSQASGTTYTTTADTTTTVNQFALIHHNTYNGASVETLSGSFIDLVVGLKTTNYGSWGIGAHFYPSSGSTVQTTATITSDPASYIQTIFSNGSGASTETGTVVMAFGPLGFSVAAARKESAGVVMAFGPLGFNVAAKRSESAAVVMAFGPIGLAVKGFDILKSTLRQFWTR